MTHINPSTQTHFRIRLAKTTSELKTLLKLRYEVLRTEFPMYVPENNSKIDFQFSHGFIEVRENHLKAYTRYGFREVASKYVPQDQCSHFLCYAHCSDLPGYLTEKLGSMRQEYDRWGEITINSQV